MKRKYFSALLMGALTIASVSTFTSCKDYDDDINNLQSQIDALSKTLSELQTKINDGSILKSVESDGNGGIIVTVTKNGTDTSYNIKQGVQGAAGKDGDVWKIGENGYWYKNDTKTEYYALGTKGDKGDKGDQGDKGEAGTAGKDGKYYVPNPDTGTFWIYGDGDKDAYDSKIVYTATNADVITAVWDNDNLTLTNVAGAPGKKVVVSLSSALKSLVFDPDFYYAGIEAFDFATYKYNPATVKAVDADGDYSKDAPTVAGDAFTYAPDLAATYFLNPSNAKMSNDAAKYSFIAYNKDYVSRAAADYGSTFKVESADLTTKGKVTVHAKYNGNAIKDLANSDKVTVLALQYTSGDSVVTSDFAAIKASTYDKLVLNNPTLQHVDAIPSHLYQTAKDAINNKAQIHVAWNSNGIDLREYVNTDRTYDKDEHPTCKAWDKNAAEGLVEKSGFKYSFELVGYKSGANQTSQSAHAAIASNGYTLRPQMPADGKQQAYGAAQNEATIGREPLVRVILKDTVNNKIAAVGYIKVVIDKTVAKAEEVDLVTVNKPYTIACGDNNIDLQKVTWAQVEEQLYAKLNMSKEAFEDAYGLDGGTADANQFEKATTDAEALAADKKIGTVSQTAADIEGKMTEVIAWSIKNQAAYAAFKAGKTTLSTYVRYALKPGKTAANKYVYVKLTWTPSAINLKPSTTFGNENKIKKYWYAANSAVAGTGYDDVHGNVEVVGTEGANDEYVFDLKNALVGNKLSVNPLTAPYADLNQELKLTFGFVTGKGLFASEDGTKVYAEKELTNVVASLDPVTGIVTYAKNETAKKLLNAYGHKDLKNTVTAIVAVKATICGNIDVPVASNEFNVKFLRPINVENATASFEDAETAGSTAKINLTFTDWRDHNFTDSNVTKGQDYFKYYGVKEIAVDIDNATTDLNGNSSQKLKDLTDKVKFTFSAPATISAKEYGELKYENNGLTVGQFHVYFPATITYDWGTIKATITATVGKTQNNAHRH
mgnify:FL=1